MASKEERQAAIKHASKLVNSGNPFLQRAGQEKKVSDLEKWLAGLTREQRLKFAELAYPAAKAEPGYDEMTAKNNEALANAKAHQEFREDHQSKYETRRELKEQGVQTVGWFTEPNDVIDPSLLEGLTDETSKIDMDKLEESVRLFFEGIGDDPNRDGIKDTPKRVAKVWAETMNGYTLKPEDYVTMFENDSSYDGAVMVRDMEFYTKCEHHLEPFSGTIDIAYWPTDKIIGLSKLLRVARVFCKRPQNQERLTMQIADALHDLLGADGVAVRIKAEHYCMISRGLRIKGAYTHTETARGDGYTGVFYDG